MVWAVVSEVSFSHFAPTLDLIYTVVGCCCVDNRVYRHVWVSCLPAAPDLLTWEARLRLGWSYPCPDSFFWVARRICCCCLWCGSEAFSIWVWNRCYTWLFWNPNDDLSRAFPYNSEGNNSPNQTCFLFLCSIFAYRKEGWGSKRIWSWRRWRLVLRILSLEQLRNFVFRN